STALPGPKPFPHPQFQQIPPSPASARRELSSTSARCPTSATEPSSTSILPPPPTPSAPGSAIPPVPRNGFLSNPTNYSAFLEHIREFPRRPPILPDMAKPIFYRRSDRQKLQAHYS